MLQRWRAPLAAAVALMIGGDVAARGVGAFLDVWRFLFPYLWLFLLIERVRRARRVDDDEAFLLGAATGLLHGGLVLKTLQDGALPLGIDWLAALTSAFDWGLVTVLALHALDWRLPRPPEPAGPGALLDLLELAALVFIPAGLLAAFLGDMYTGRSRVDLALGPTWLLADLLFALMSWALYSRALARARSDEPLPREPVVWGAAALCAWIPGAQLAVRLGGARINPLSLTLISLWTAGFALWFAGLWRRRGVFAAAPRRALAPVLSLAAWRLAGAVLLAAVVGSMDADPRAGAAFTILVDLPVRLGFVGIFFVQRVAV